MKSGIIVLGHGSKAPQALETLKTISTMVAEELVGIPVEIASMEFNKPSLSDAVATLVAQDVKKIIIAPFFLFFGIHMQKDIPELIAEEKAKYSDLEIIMAGNLGADNKLAEILLDRIKEVL